MVVVDRASDLVTPLRHSAAYAALVKDVFHMEHNRCQIPTTDNTPIVFSVDPRDPLWTQHADSAFPEAAEAVDRAVRQYKQDHDAIGDGSTAADLRNAIEVLPELTERKRVIDMHLQACQALLAVIKERRLGDLFALEQRLDRSDIIHFLTNDAGDDTMMEDKCRLYLVYMLSRSDPQFERDCQPFLKRLSPELTQKIGAILQHVDLHRTVSSLPTSPRDQDAGNYSTQSEQEGWSRGLLSGLATGVKTLMMNATNTQQDLVLVRTCRSLVDHLTTGTPTPVDHVLMDPNSQAQTKGRSAYNHIIVFVVGGIARQEYAALLAAFSQYPVVSVGGSAVVSGGDILRSF